MAWGRAAVYYKHFLCAAAAASQKPKSTRAYVFVGPHGAVKFAALSLVLQCWGLIVARVCATRTIRRRNRCTIPSHLVLLELQLARPLKVMNGGACDALSRGCARIQHACPSISAHKCVIRFALVASS